MRRRVRRVGPDEFELRLPDDERSVLRTLPAQLRASGDGYDAPLLWAAAAQFGGPIPIAELHAAGRRLGSEARSLTT